jgi:hypothetical protein
MKAEGLDWPLGLRILPGSEPLRKRIDALFQVAAAQAAAGSMTASMPLDMYRSVEKLEKLVQKDKFDRLTLSSDQYAEAERFLRRLKRAARSVATEQTSPPSSPQPAAASSGQQPRY